MINIQTYMEQKHPRLFALCSLAGDAWRFVFSGYIVLSLSRWFIVTCGRLAESVLLLCCLWITSQSVAPELFQGLGTNRIATITSITLLLLALLPEVVLFSAIIITLERLRSALARRSIESWVWAVLFLLPTLAFFGMTLYTLVTLALTDHIIHQEHWAVVTRCVSAWLYALIGMIYANWHSVQSVHQGKQTGGASCPPDTQPLLQGLQEANRAAIQEAIQQLRSVTVQLVEETVNRHSATISLAREGQPQIEASQDDTEGERSGEQGVHSDERPVLSVPGIPQDKVNQILALHLTGTPWRAIPGNYSRTIKPIKDAYELFTQVNGK
jgi:hypothetical protein